MSIRSVVPEDSIEIDGIEDAIEETDELLSAVAMLSATNTTEFNRLNERITECLNKVEALSMTQLAAESPLLTQLLTMTTELRAEMTTLRSSVDSMQSNLIELRSVPPIQTETITEETETPPSAEVENPAAKTSPELPKKKNRFI